MIRLLALAAILIGSGVAEAQRGYRTTPTGYVYRGRTYTLGVDLPRGNCQCPMCQRLRAAYYSANTPQPIEYTVRQEVPKEVATDFVPSPENAVEALWTIIQPKRGEILLDPGCGDGRILIEGAKRFGTRGIGIEINPTTAAEAIRRVADAGLDDSISITRGDSREWNFDSADYVVLYLYDDLLRELSPKLRNTKPGATVVSYMHRLPAGFLDQKEVNRGRHRFFVWKHE